jgi:hypothetical protein
VINRPRISPTSRFWSLARAHLLFIAVAAGCVDSPVAPTASAAPIASAPLATVPFKGQGTGQDVSVSFEADGIYIVANASGTATGVGYFTERLDYVLGYDLVNFGGTGMITAADGAQLFISFTGAIPGFADQVFPLPYTVQYSITGGTGRLSGSQGQGTIDGTDFGGGSFAFSFTGSRTIP